MLALPALERAAALERRAGGRSPLVQIVAGLAPLLRLAGVDVDPLPLEDRRAVVRAAVRLRGTGASRGVLLTPSVSAALVFLLAGVRSRRGVRSPGRGWMLTEPIDRAPLLEGHRVLEFLRVVGGDDLPEEPPAPRLRAPEEARRAWEALAARLDLPRPVGRTVGLFPGAKAPSRRWPPERFAELAGRLAADGRRVLVFGGPDDRALTARVAAGAEVAGSAGRAFDLGGRTGLAEMTGGLAACDVLVTNDTGPMHVAAALDVAIVALEGPADVRQTRPLASRVRLVGRFDLPCVPCVRNECPRRGRGFLLDEAERECMRLIRVDEVHEATESLLERSG